tara:strand:- start:429175 stop:430926 length:1752 start_codon:yes stop_codon:yes gene_type:complete
MKFLFVKPYTRLLLLLLAVSMAGCKQSPSTAESLAAADTVLFNGRIYTANVGNDWVEAVAIADGVIVYAGSNEGALATAHDDTQRVDVNGAMVMPGINDGHAHPSWGGQQLLYECRFGFTATPDEIAQALRQCIEADPDSQWITGGQWTSDFFANHDIGSPRRWLDEISTEKAILLGDDSLHNAWANSKALELAGINRDTVDPEAGKYARDANGEPNGLLYETAANFVRSRVPQLTTEQRKAAILAAIRQGNRFGVTGINDALVDPDTLRAYVALDTAGALTARLSVSLVTPMEYRVKPLEIDKYVALRDLSVQRNVDARFVKMFLDGVPTAARTALMLENYQTDAAHPHSTRGDLQVDPQVLAQDLIALDKAGFTVKLHAAGDGSIRVALNALQLARQANGQSGLRHELAHAGYIDPADLPRFAELDVVADLSPALWFPSPVMDSVIGAVGERGRHYFPVKALLDSGAATLLGSDWPAVAVDLNPWPAIEGLVTRRNPSVPGGEALWPEQAVSLEQALAIATLEGARALRLQHRTGSIEVGKSADLIVLNQNLFEIPAHKIGDTQVIETWFEGKRVFGRSAL